MDEPVYFATAFEGLYLKGLKGRVDAPLQDALRAEGLDLSRPLLPAYPLAVWQRCIRATADRLYPGQPLEAAVRELGLTFLRGFLQTLIGKAVFTLGRTIGTERTLLRMGHNTRSNTNVYESEVKKLGPGHLEFHNYLAPQFVGRVPPLPEGQVTFLEGVVRGIFEGLEVQPTKVELRLISAEKHQSVTELRWTA